MTVKIAVGLIETGLTYEEIQADLITIPGFEDFNWIIHNSPEKTKTGWILNPTVFNISHLETGVALILEEPTKVKALEMAVIKLELNGREGLLSAIAKCPEQSINTLNP